MKKNIKTNKIKKLVAFSLIEILQTVILMGLIAGLSISFFKKVNVDDKLFYSTQDQLVEAVQEAGKQMCADATPYCSSAQSFWVNCDLSTSAGCSAQYNASCAAIYTGSSYNLNTKYCELSAPSATCPDGMYLTLDKTKCFIPPICSKSTVTDSAGNTITKTEIAIPYHEHVCPNGNPYFVASAANTKNNPHHAGASELCYRLHSIINHKKQGNTIADDLNTTCSSVADCVLAANCSAGTLNDQNINKVNMILPNGARLYNMNSAAIIIKYDRIPYVATITSIAENATDNIKTNNAAKIEYTELYNGKKHGISTSTTTGASTSAGQQE